MKKLIDLRDHIAIKAKLEKDYYSKENTKSYNGEYHKGKAVAYFSVLEALNVLIREVEK